MPAKIHSISTKKRRKPKSQVRRLTASRIAWGLVVWSFAVQIASAASGPLRPCDGDFNADGHVTIDEIVTTVDNALQGCTLVPRVSLEGVEAHELRVCFEEPNPLRGDAGTISFEIQPEWAGSDSLDYPIASLRTPNKFGLVSVLKSGSYLRFLISDDTGQETNIGLNIGSWTPGESHTVTASWGPTLSLEIDGQLVGSVPSSGIEFTPGACLVIGQVSGSATSATATVRHFKLYQAVAQ